MAVALVKMSSEIPKKPSFLIQDILSGNTTSKSSPKSASKSPGLHVPPVSPAGMAAGLLRAYEQFHHAQAVSLAQGIPIHPGGIPVSLAMSLTPAHPGMCFPTASSPLIPSPPPGLALQGGETFNVPIPLPVYVRTKSPSCSDGLARPKKCRRSRTVFTELQLMGLEKKFETQKYLSTPDRMELAETLGLSQIQVKTWYQNRRMKWKKQVLQGGGSEPPTKPKGRPKKNPTSESAQNIVLANETGTYSQERQEDDCT